MNERMKPNFQAGKKNKNEVEISSKNNWLEKLKPSTKNAIMKDKLFNALNNSNADFSKEDDFKIKIQPDRATGNIKKFTSEFR